MTAKQQKKSDAANVEPKEVLEEARPPQPPPPKTEEEDEGGSIRISENVIAAVVRKYTLEVQGVVRFATASIVGGIAEMIGRKSAEGSVVVDLDGDSVDISVTLILEFGVKIPEVAALVQDVIKSRVEELTGKHVNKVNVIVQDLEEVIHEEEAPASATQGEETPSPES